MDNSAIINETAAFTNCFLNLISWAHANGLKSRICTDGEKWTIKDYSTAGLKAEVKIDMLISEFIEEMKNKS